MIVLCIFMCVFMMRGRMGSMMCRPGSRDKNSHSGDTSDSALNVLNKRYAQGEISKEEYEEKRSVTRRLNVKNRDNSITKITGGMKCTRKKRKTRERRQNPPTSDSPDGSGC
jgi:hypothetical protein